MPTQTGSALLPLHGGRAPRRLFQRMALPARGAVRRARLGERDRVDALRRLAIRYGGNSL